MSCLVFVVATHYRTFRLLPARSDVWIGHMLRVKCMLFETPLITFNLPSFFSLLVPMSCSGKTPIVCGRNLTCTRFKSFTDLLRAPILTSKAEHHRENVLSPLWQHPLSWTYLVQPRPLCACCVSPVFKSTIHKISVNLSISIIRAFVYHSIRLRCS